MVNDVIKASGIHVNSNAPIVNHRGHESWASMFHLGVDPFYRKLGRKVLFSVWETPNCWGLPKTLTPRGSWMKQPVKHLGNGYSTCDLIAESPWHFLLCVDVDSM